MGNTTIAAGIFIFLFVFQALLFFAAPEIGAAFTSQNSIDKAQSFSNGDIGYNLGTLRFILQLAFPEFFGLPVYISIIILIFKVILIIAAVAIIFGSG